MKIVLVILLATLLGVIQIGEYSTENPKVRKLLSYLKIAVLFTSIGLSLGNLNI